MNNPATVVRGTLKSDGTLELDETPNLPAGPVQITLQSIPAPPATGRSWWDTLQAIKQEQRSQRRRSPTLEEFQADQDAVRRENEEYEERWRQIWEQTSE